MSSHRAPMYRGGGGGGEHGNPRPSPGPGHTSPRTQANVASPRTPTSPVSVSDRVKVALRAVNRRDDPVSRERGLRVLARLALREEYARFVVDVRAVAALRTLLTASKDIIVASAMTMYANIASHASLRSAVYEAKVCETVMSLIPHHNDVVTQFALNFVTNQCMDPPSCAFFVQAGLPRKLMIMLETGTKHEELILSRVWRHLLFADHGMRQAFLACGGVKFVKQVFTMCFKGPMLFGAVAAVMELVRDVRTHAVIAASDVVEDVLACVRCPHVKVAATAVRALRMLCRSHSGLHAVLQTSPVLAMIEFIEDTPVDQLSLIVSAIKLVILLCTNDKALDSIATLGGEEFIMYLSVFLSSSNDSVVEPICTLLKLLATVNDHQTLVLTLARQEEQQRSAPNANVKELIDLLQECDRLVQWRDSHRYSQSIGTRLREAEVASTGSVGVVTVADQSREHDIASPRATNVSTQTSAPKLIQVDNISTSIASRDEASVMDMQRFMVKPSPRLSKRVSRMSSRERLSRQSKLRRDSARRHNILGEILHTERRYVLSLFTIVKNYQDMFERHVHEASDPVLSLDDVNIIFCNVRSIYDMHKSALKQLDRALHGASQSQAQVGPIFIALCDKLKCYTTYIKNYTSSVELITALERKAKFVALCDECKSSIPGGGLSMENYLVMPIQRVPRYGMLLAELSKATPDSHPDAPALRLAATKMQETNTFLDREGKLSHQKRALVTLSSAIYNAPNSLYQPGREILKDGILFQETKNGSKYRRVVLMTDILIITGVKKKRGLELKAIVPVVGVKVLNVKAEASDRFCFKMLASSEDRQTESHMLYSTEEVEKMDWVKRIRAASQAQKEQVRLKRAQEEGILRRGRE